jgi:predicted TPR repeat methyltransferase
MFNPSGYRENDQGLANDRDYLVANLPTHLEAARELVAGLRALQPGATRLLDIGAGVGSLVMTAREAGLEAEGVELNHHAVAWAADRGVALHGSRFHANLFPQPFDIVTCNHVLEHLAAPRELAADAIKAVRAGGLLFLSVPFLPEPASAATQYAMEPEAPGSPFFDNDAHVTHFSRVGLVSMAASLGLVEAQPLECSLAGYVFRVR